MKRDLWIDFETRSPLKLKVVGAAAYAEEAEVLCMAYAFDQGPVRIWVPELPFPPELIDALNDPEVILNAWNAAFEQAIWPKLTQYIPQVPTIPIARWRCTMAHALCCGYPAGLDECAVAIGSTYRKKADGRALIDRYCKPRSGKNVGGTYNDVAEFFAAMKMTESDCSLEAAIAEHPDIKATEIRSVWQTGRFYRYCMADVEAERGVHNKLMKWPASEIKVWHLDQKINQRGVKVDVNLASELIRLSDHRKQELNEELMTVTGGWVEKASHLRDLLTWLQGEGVQTETLRKADVTALLDQIDDPDIPISKALSIRQAAAKSSIAKFQKMLSWATTDYRLKNNAQYYASHTGRWGGRGVQLQNLPRGVVKRDMFDLVIDLILESQTGVIRSVFGEPLDVFGSLIRGCLVPDIGHRLVVGDFSQIEARGLAWLAGEDSLVEAFATGADVYKMMASKIFNKPVASISKDGFERFIGKCAILGLGYQMGASKFVDAVVALGGPRLDEEFTKPVVKVFREEYQQIVNLWYEVERCAKAAIKVPNTPVQCGKLAFVANAKTLLLILPNKRCIHYPFPVLVEKPSPYGMRESITYMGMCPFRHRWSRLDTYGGKLVENAVQGLSRDVMVEAMQRLDGSHFEILFTVHDEIATQSRTGTAEEMEELMRVRPAWAQDCPISAEAWSGTRYGK